MANKYKKVLHFLVTKKMQVKILMRYHYTPNKLKFKNTNNAKFCIENDGVNEVNTITWKTALPINSTTMSTQRNVCMCTCENKHVYMHIYVHTSVCVQKKNMYKNARMFIKALFLTAKPKSINSRINKLIMV